MSFDWRSIHARLLYWILLDGNRLVVAGVIVLASFLLTLWLTLEGVITVGPTSAIRSLLSSGIASGLLALVTVSLSINQLVLSRVFGPPNELFDRYDGSIELRERVERLTDSSSTPTDPGAFVGVIAEGLREQADALEEASGTTTDEVQDALSSHADDIHSYAAQIDDVQGGDTDTNTVLITLLGGEYAECVAETRRLEAEHGARLSPGLEEQLDDLLDSFRALAVTRQYLKTLAIQQDLARLSRLVAYTGLVAFLVTVYLTLVYRSSTGATLPPTVLRPVASVGIATIVTPLAILIVYMLRVATIARYTVSAGPFVPPEEQLPDF